MQYREVEAECARLPTVPLDIHVLPDEAMAPAGEISGILEGDQIIIQVGPQSSAVLLAVACDKRYSSRLRFIGY